jgi:hypothetical protein
LLKSYNKGNLILHQGLTKSNSGHYIQDKSALSPEDVAGRRVVSGHYHTRQTIDLPDGGKWDYIGNPYTLNFAEASDPEKGFQILYDDGSLEFVPTNLRKHIVVEMPVDIMSELTGGMINIDLGPQDLLWLKVRGSAEQLTGLSKEGVAKVLGLKQSFRFELQPNEVKTQTPQGKQQTITEVMDQLIDSLTETSIERKKRLRAMWRDFAE